ncbi:MAG: HAMP domain-containing histidine kinase [Thermoanaerobaculia bacterium]|nr:HAMP domain-containing histidine kinase [Thermoanaerobaculia bacterium]
MTDFALSLLDNLELPIAILTDKGEIDYRNLAFAKTFGDDAELWVAKAAKTNVSGERGWLQLLFSARDRSESIEAEFQSRTYRISRVHFDNDDSATKVGLTFDDVTRQREMEQAKSDFTSMIVHDLRGPLSGIQGTLEFVLSSQETRLDPMHEELLLEASRESERMMGLINELLDFSKIESGNFEVERDPVHLAGILRRSVKSLQSVASRDEVHLLTAHGSDLPMIHGSAEKLTQAVINLVSNSVKFTPQKGVIAVGAKLLRGDADNDSIVVTITDTGVGMSPEDLSRIFEKYKQSKSKSVRGGAGTGLGLYIVKQVIEAHGGSVTVSSLQGVGTSMVLKLPLRRVA